MKIYNLAEFLKLPAGTVYECKTKEEVSIGAHTWVKVTRPEDQTGSSWIAKHLLGDIDAKNLDEHCEAHFKAHDEMMAVGVSGSIALDFQSTTRERHCNEDDHYYVYEPQDIRAAFADVLDLMGLGYIAGYLT